MQCYLKGLFSLTHSMVFPLGLFESLKMSFHRLLMKRRTLGAITTQPMFKNTTGFCCFSIVTVALLARVIRSKKLDYFEREKIVMVLI